MEPSNVPVVLAIVGGVALLLGVLGGGIEAEKIKIPSLPLIVRIIAGTIGVILIGVSIWLYSSTAIKGQQTTVAAVPATGLEAELAKANIVLSEVPDKSSQVSQWLLSDPQYQTMAQSILSALAGKRVRDPIPLDVITSKYRVALGGTEGTNFPSEQYKDIDKVKTAIFDTWKERHPDFSQKSFDEIVEKIK